MSASPPSALRMLFWESTARCNLSCAHCRRLDPQDACGDLSTDEARAMLDSAARLGRPLVVFSGGEPLLRDDWEDLAAHARRQGLPLALATNGTLVDAAAACRVARADFHRVAVSLDAADPDRHDAFRGPGAFRAAMNGLTELRAAGQTVQVNATIRRDNLDQLDRLHDLARQTGAAALHLFVLVPVGCGMTLPDEYRVTPAQCREVLEWIVARQAAGPLELRATCAPQYVRVARQWLERLQSRCIGIGDPLRDPASPGAERVRSMLRGRGCLAGTGVLFVSHRGEVFPCGYLPIFCGSVRNGWLEEVWLGSPVLEQLRDPERLKRRCGRCDFRADCGGCRARAFAAGGDFLGEDPMCDFPGGC